MSCAHAKRPRDMAAAVLATSSAPTLRLHALPVLHRLRQGRAGPGSMSCLVDMYRTRRRQAQRRAAVFARGGAP